MTPLPVTPWLIYISLSEKPDQKFPSIEALAEASNTSCLQLYRWLPRLHKASLINFEAPDMKRRGGPRGVALLNANSNDWVNEILGCKDVTQ